MRALPKTGNPERIKNLFWMSLVSRARLWAFFEALYSYELHNQSPKYTTPEWIKTPLLPHQQSAVAAALGLEKAKTAGLDISGVNGDSVGGKLYSSYGILGDRVGAGKSLTALALIKEPAPDPAFMEYVSRNEIHLGDGRDVGLLRKRSQLKNLFDETLTPVDVSLFIIPHALVGQWETYVSRDTHLNAWFIKRRADLCDENFMDRLRSYDVVFVSSSMWSGFRNHPIRSLLWKRIFIDEADSIHITTDIHELNGLFYWFISASWLNLVFSGGAYFNIMQSHVPLPNTPQSIIDRVQRLRTDDSPYLQITGCKHMNIVRKMCGVAANYNTHAINAAVIQSARLIIHNAESYIQESFAVPTITHQSIMCAMPTNIRVLSDILSPDIMERLHADDVSGALEMIGMSAHNEMEITAAVTESLKKELDNAVKTYDYKQSITYSSDAAKAKALEVCEQKIASIRSRISAIEERIKTAKEQSCPICFCEPTTPAVVPCCHQVFCFSCICESLSRVASCPLCRTRIESVRQLQVIGTTTAVPVTTERPQKLQKKDAFIEFVKLNPNAKILMFSGYDASFSSVENKMKEASISFATVKGSNARITKLLNEFKAGKYNVLFLNARNMGAGLNIESASHVVLFHHMNNELESQIIGRAMRLGRKEPLTVVHLLHENEQQRGDVISHV